MTELDDPFVDEEMEPDPELNRWTNAIIGAAIEVHRILGPGFLESVYEAALAMEMTSRGIPFSRQHQVQVMYEGQNVGIGRLDFLVGETVIVDLKTIDSIAPIHVATMMSYLKTTGRRLGLIINFNVGLLKNGIRRIAL